MVGRDSRPEFPAAETRRKMQESRLVSNLDHRELESLVLSRKAFCCLGLS